MPPEQPKLPISLPEVEAPKNAERDAIIRHANFLIANGYIKDMTITEVIAQLEKPVDKRNAKNNFETFDDLNDPT